MSEWFNQSIHHSYWNPFHSKREREEKMALKEETTISSSNSYGFIECASILRTSGFLSNFRIRKKPERCKQNERMREMTESKNTSNAVHFHVNVMWLHDSLRCKLLVVNCLFMHACVALRSCVRCGTKRQTTAVRSQVEDEAKPKQWQSRLKQKNTTIQNEPSLTKRNGTEPDRNVRQHCFVYCYCAADILRFATHLTAIHFGFLLHLSIK